MVQAPVWLITGCSSGFGLEIARAALARGHRVIASSRNPGKSAELVDGIKSKGGEWISLDVCWPKEKIQDHINDATKLYGRIDILVNNAGYGTVGGFEDFTEDDIFCQYMTNVLGVWKVTQSVLPQMRSQGCGTIVNVSSASGFRGLAAVSLYASSKFAVEGLTESLAAEYACFGIKAILVEPSGFETGFASAMQSKPPSAFYLATPVGLIHEYMTSGPIKQPGDPVKAGNIIVDVVTRKDDEEIGENAYLRLPLGKAAYKAGIDKATGMRDNFEAMRSVAESADSEDN